MTIAIADYDSDQYDYRTYWRDRDYERWAEDRALRRLVPLLGEPAWLVDFGAGFGRNAVHYRSRARRYVLVDYSATNLANAAGALAADVDAGRAYLVRADLNRLPFTDHAFDAALVVRVLHHLPDVDGALGEMGRTVGGRWLLDVPIKHHALGLARAAARGELAAVCGPAPLMTGTTDSPFWNFRLSAVRDRLAADGWDTRPVASVNNLRRWDRSLPATLVRTLRPAIRAVEAGTQRAGCGWWGPSQFVYAHRRVPMPVSSPGRPDAPTIAARMAGPGCRGALDWTPVAATCGSCGSVYPKTGGYWDFTTARPGS